MSRTSRTSGWRPGVRRQARASRLAVLEEVNAKRGVFGRMGESMGRSLVEGLLRRVVVRISDVHLRLETKDPHRGLVALGLTLRSGGRQTDWLRADEEVTLVVSGLRAPPPITETESIGVPEPTSASWASAKAKATPSSTACRYRVRRIKDKV